MRLVQGLVFAILTEMNCLFLFRTEVHKEHKGAISYFFDRST